MRGPLRREGRRSTICLYVSHHPHKRGGAGGAECSQRRSKPRCNRGQCQQGAWCADAVQQAALGAQFMGGDIMLVVKLCEPWWGSHSDERDNHPCPCKRVIVASVCRQVCSSSCAGVTRASAHMTAAWQRKHKGSSPQIPNQTTASCP